MGLKKKAENFCGSRLSISVAYRGSDVEDKTKVPTRLKEFHLRPDQRTSFRSESERMP